MKISMIAAMAKHNVIGSEGDMPWNLPADLAHFKKLTMGKPVVMGRATFESIGRLLPGRENVIITRQLDYDVPGATICHSTEQALTHLATSDEIMIIGGGEIYKQFLRLANTLYLTKIDLEAEGDTHFPKVDEKQWVVTEVKENAPDEKNPYYYRFETLVRI